MLKRWLGQVEVAFAGRVFAVDDTISDQRGRMGAIRPNPVIDGLLAANAMVHGFTLVTRNDRDIVGLGATVLNPFQLGQELGDSHG